jgi:hypothetical protein
MSIYCSIFDIGGEHKLSCARIRKIRHKEYQEDASKPCTCGVSPIRYKGSHVLPAATDERGGVLSLAAIPNHITRDGRDDRPENGKCYPWLRVSMYETETDSVVLTRAQAKRLRDALSEWLDSASTRVPKEG